MSELPENVKRIDVLRVERGLMKKCRCSSPHYLVDPDNRLVYCDDCGAIVDAFDALYYITRYWDHMSDQVQFLLDQRKEIMDWKPWLVPLREVEKTYRSGKYLPYCPHCRRGILAEELAAGSVSKKYELRHRQKEGDHKGDYIPGQAD